MKNLLRALQYFRPDFFRLAVVFGLLICSIGTNLLKPWPLALAVDCVLSGKAFPAWLGKWLPADPILQVGVLAVLLFLAHAMHGLLTATHQYLAIAIGLRGLTRVRNDVFGWLQRLSLRFHRSAKVGDLIHRAAWDTYAFQTLFQQGLVTSFGAVLSLAFMIVVMARVQMTLTVVVIATVPLLLAVMIFFGRKMQQRGLAAQRADSEVTARVQQSIAALPLIQSYTREEAERGRFQVQSDEARQKRLTQHGWELLYSLAVLLVFGLATAWMVWLGVTLVLTQQLTFGSLLVFLTYLAQLYEPLNQLSFAGSTVSTASAGVQRVFEILDTPEEVKDAPNARAVVRAASLPVAASAGCFSVPLPLHGDITFDHVSFCYEQEQAVLDDVSFRLRAGESMAIIGPSGVGKTTLLNLLLRFFDPTAGTVRLDGVDVRELRVKDLRAHIALVLQEPIVLPATVAENIAYGRPEASRAEIEAASSAANADEFIRKLPRQYDALVGEAAAPLSVGEKQRLNLARAFLKDSPILLLDEPTSALDAESEKLVVESLVRLKQGRTTLIVAHRLSTIRCVDKVLVLEDGRVTEFGMPEELMKQPGYYARAVAGKMALD